MTLTTLDGYARRGALLVPAAAVPAPVTVDLAPAEVAPQPIETRPVETRPAALSRRERREARAAAQREQVAQGNTARVQRWAARAAEARQLRELMTDPDVQAVQLMRQRARWTAMAWSALTFSLAFTMVNVQRFAAGHAEKFDPMWWVAWVVDPAFSVLLIGLLIARGQLSAVLRSVPEPVVRVVEFGLLGATTVMNVMPELTRSFRGGLREQLGSIVLHLLVPLLAFAAASVITILQDHFSAAIAELGRPVQNDADEGDAAPTETGTVPELTESGTTGVQKSDTPALRESAALAVPTVTSAVSDSVPAAVPARRASSSPRSSAAKPAPSGGRRAARPVADIDVSDLLVPGRRVRDRLAGEGTALTRDLLIAGLRADGHTVSSTRASALLRALNTEPHRVVSAA